MVYFLTLTSCLFSTLNWQLLLKLVVPTGLVRVEGCVAVLVEMFQVLGHSYALGGIHHPTNPFASVD